MSEFAIFVGLAIVKIAVLVVLLLTGVAYTVWLERQELEAKVSPISPAALRDEIQRLVPGYGVDRLNLLAGNDVHTRTEESAVGRAEADELILPAKDDLFSSGTLGRYSSILNQVMERQMQLPGEKEVAAD